MEAWKLDFAHSRVSENETVFVKLGKKVLPLNEMDLRLMVTAWKICLALRHEILIFFFPPSIVFLLPVL